MPERLLDAGDVSLEDLFKGNLFLIPVYQRPYSWGKDQIKVLLKDLYDSYCSRNDEDELGLFAGTIILHDNRSKNKGIPVYNIIDGQQRIATFSLFLLAAYSLFFLYGIDQNDDTFHTVKNCLWKYFERKNQGDLQILRLNSVEKRAFDDLFAEGFLRPKNLKTKVQDLISSGTSSKFENNVLQNFLDIFLWFENMFGNDASHEELLNFVDFVLSRTKMVRISSSVSENKAFGIFQSINGKAKALDPIDLIKTHIFSKLSENDYSEYLEKWGELIFKTNDNLYDYLLVYIRAYLRYYQNNMSMVNFASLDDQLISFFGVVKISDAYKKLLEDMLAKVGCYQMLSDCDSAYYGLIRQTKFRFYYLMFTRMDYKHPRPLFFRLFNDVQSNRIDKNDAAIIVIEIVKFMISYLTINGRDSKDIIPVFSAVAERIYRQGYISKDFILHEIGRSAINDEKTAAELRRLDVYDKNKKLGSALLSIADSVFVASDGQKRCSWDEAYTYYLQAGDAQSLDHLLVKDPSPRDPNVKYYEKNGFLRLKQDSDFPDEFDERTPWKDFRSKVLNVIGNLDLKGHDANAQRKNTTSSDFFTYRHIQERANVIIPDIMKFGLQRENPSPNYDPNADLISSEEEHEIISLVTERSFSKKRIFAISITNLTNSFDVRSFREALESVADYLYSIDSEKFVRLADQSFSFSKKGKPVLGHEESAFNRPYLIPQSDVFLETNMNANDIIRFIKALLLKFNIDPQGCSVEIAD